MNWAMISMWYAEASIFIVRACAECNDDVCGNKFELLATATTTATTTTL